MTSVLILFPYPIGIAPSQRFRVENYIPYLTDSGFKIIYSSFFNIEEWNSLKKYKSPWRHVQIFMKSWFLQLLKIIKNRKVNYVFVHREISPIGPPILEWLIVRVMKKKLIYDFDDAIWTTDNKLESSLEKFFRWRKKVKTLCKWSYKVSVGNSYLAQFAKQFTSSITINPTTVNTEQVYNRHVYKVENKKDNLTIVWTGSSSTLKYLEQLEPVLIETEKRFPKTNFLIIADQAPILKIKNLIFKRWDRENEVSALLEGDIGIMPLPDDDWSKGKCGFKAIQYMALEIPCLASPVGVNVSIIQSGENGYLCKNDDEWLSSIELLIKNIDLRKTIGESGRKTIIENYSESSNKSNFLSLFE